MRSAVFCTIPFLALVAAAADRDSQPPPKETPKAKKKNTENSPAAKSRKAPEATPGDREEPPRADRPAPSLKVGSDLPGSFDPYNATGPRRGNFHCIVSEHGLNPLVLVFVTTLDLGNPLKDLLHKLDALIENNPGLHLAAMVVYAPDELKNLLVEDDRRDQLAVALEDLARANPALKHVVLALDTKKDVASYLVKDDAALTLVLQRKYRVESLHLLTRAEVTEDAVSKIISEIAEKVGAKKK